jgi:nucleoside-diphosphate-sugar epimerase
MKNKILLTGANGFIGKKVYSYLSKQKIPTKIIIRRNKNKKLKESNVVYTKNLFRENQQWWNQILKDVKTIIHLAWSVKPGQYLNTEENIECLLGTIKIAKACKVNNVEKFIGIGTCFEYAISKKKLDINSKIDPKSLYAASKASVYFLLKNFLYNTKTKFSWIRLFYIAGKDDYKEKLIPYLHNKLSSKENVIIKDGNSIRDYLDVEKVAKKIILIAKKKNNAPVYNVCSGVPTSIKKIAISIAKKYNAINYLNFRKNKNKDYIVGIKNC